MLAANKPRALTVVRVSQEDAESTRLAWDRQMAWEQERAQFCEEKQSLRFRLSILEQQLAIQDDYLQKLTHSSRQGMRNESRQETAIHGLCKIIERIHIKEQIRWGFSSLKDLYIASLRSPTKTSYLQASPPSDEETQSEPFWTKYYRPVQLLSPVLAQLCLAESVCCSHLITPTDADVVLNLPCKCWPFFHVLPSVRTVFRFVFVVSKGDKDHRFCDMCGWLGATTSKTLLGADTRSYCKHNHARDL
jgi:hypothetical protein